jgi:hypothetical protein
MSRASHGAPQFFSGRGSSGTSRATIGEALRRRGSGDVAVLYAFDLLEYDDIEIGFDREVERGRGSSTLPPRREIPRQKMRGRDRPHCPHRPHAYRNPMRPTACEQHQGGRWPVLRTP